MKKGIFSKISVGILTITLGTSIPTVVSSCSSNSKSTNTNLLTTYDNCFDDAISLGIKPDVHSAGNWISTPAKYISELATEVGTKISDTILYPRGQGTTINVKEIKKTNADLVISNILDKRNEKDLNKVVNNFAYTARGFDSSWCYNGELINFVKENADGTYTDVGFEGKSDNLTMVDSSNKPLVNDFVLSDYGYSYRLYELQQNPFLALSRLAESLDELTNNKHNFRKKAYDIEAKQQERLKALNDNPIIQQKINGKTIGFILGKKSETNPLVDENFHLYTPHTYPQFYSKYDDTGLKMNFPVFNDVSFYNASHFADPDIIAGDASSYHTFKDSNNGSKIIEAFKYKFDYLVYMAYDVRDSNFTEQEVVNSNISNLLKVSKNQNTTYDQKEDAIFYTTYSDMYMTTWGPIGQSLGLSKFIEWVNMDLLKNDTKKVYESNSLILYNEVLTNLNSLKSWKELK